MTANGIALGEMRWRDYVQVRGVAFDSFWKDHTTGQKRRVLFILGRGFDPRASMGLARMATAAPDCSSLHIQSAREFTSAGHPVMEMIDLWSERTKRGVSAASAGRVMGDWVNVSPV